MKNKIVQLMPVQTGLRAVYEDEDREHHMPIIALGLKTDGDIVMMTFDEDGIVHEIDEPINFKRVDIP